MKKTIVLLVSLLIAVSCSTTKEEIAREKAEMPEIYDRQELQERTRDMIETSEKLTDTQKEEFLKLHGDVISKVEGINVETRKLKMVLFDQLTDEDKYDLRKVDEIKRQLKKLTNKKLDIMLDALGDAKEILGVQFKDVYPGQLDFYNHFTQSL